MPANTTILGAAKLTGRLSSGLSIGVLGALTDNEKAQLFDVDTGVMGEVDVEPLGRTWQRQDARDGWRRRLRREGQVRCRHVRRPGHYGWGTAAAG